MDSNSNNSRWRKPADKTQQQLRKEELRRKFQENEDKRKQLAMENQRRRKERQEQLRQEHERKRKVEEQMLNQRKKDKEEAYIKYLRNNLPEPKSNLYDKYQTKKREELAQAPEVKPASKWKTPAKEDNNLVGLDLEIQATKDLECIKKFYQNGKEQLKIIEGFEEEWEDSQQLLKSALLDSLDLDAQAVAKSKHMTKNKPGLFEKDFADMKKSIAFIQEEIIRPSQPQQELKDIIGYESGSNFWNIETVKPPVKDSKLYVVETKQPKQQQPLQSQAFKKIKQQKNQPKSQLPVLAQKKPHQKKQPAKKQDGQAATKQLLKQKSNLMGWTGDIEEEAQQIFSNCSNPSRKSFPRSQILKQINEKMLKQKQKKVLEPVIQQPTEDRSRDTPKIITSKSSSKGKQTKSTSKDKLPRQIIRRTPQKISAEKDKPKRNGSLTDMRKQTIVQPLPKQKYVEEKPIIPKPSVNKSQKQITKIEPSVNEKPKKQSKTVEKFRSKLSQQYAQNKPTTTICTQDDMLHIDEFIKVIVMITKDQLREINEKQRALQMEIKKIHVESKDKIKQVEAKHQVNTAITSTKEITKIQNKANPKKNITQSQMLEESLYRIDEMLIRKEQNLKHLQQELKKKAQIEAHQQHQYTLNGDEQVSVSQIHTPSFYGKTPSENAVINPLSSSNELQQQIIRLTQQLNEKKKTQSDNVSIQSGRKSTEKDPPVVPSSNAKENSQKSTKAGPSYAELRKIKLEEEKPGKWKKAGSQQRLPQNKQKQPEPVKHNEQENIRLEQAGEDEKIQVNDRLRRLLLE